MLVLIIIINFFWYAKVPGYMEFIACTLACDMEIVTQTIVHVTMEKGTTTKVGSVKNFPLAIIIVGI